MKNNTNETITITRETYELINTFVDLLNELSDRYIQNKRLCNTEISHLELSRWAAVYKIKEAIDGDVADLIKAIYGVKDSINILNEIER